MEMSDFFSVDDPRILQKSCWEILVPQRRWVYSCKPGSPKVWKQHDGTGRIGPRQPLF